MDDTVRQGELVGKGLMAYETTEEMGAIEHLLVDVKRSLTVAIAYKVPGLIARRQSVSWKNLVSIGDRILIHTEPATHEAELAAAQNMTGLEVWTDGGDRIGTLVDLRLERDTGQVQQYLFALEHEQAQHAQPEQTEQDEQTAPMPITVYAIEPQMIISAGRKRMMIAEEDARRAQSNQESIERSPLKSPVIGQAPVFPTELPKDFGQLLQQGKTVAGRAAQQAKARAKQFTQTHLAHQDFAHQDFAHQDFLEAESLPEITEQLQAKTQQAKQQIQQQLNKAAERAEQAKEKIDGRLGQSPLGQSPLGQSLGSSLNQALDKFNKLKGSANAKSDPIDVDAFEVWEDD